MTQTFEELCAERDPLYAALKPQKSFSLAVECDRLMGHWSHIAVPLRDVRDSALLHLAIRALRNQGQPYYDAR